MSTSIAVSISSIRGFGAHGPVLKFEVRISEMVSSVAPDKRASGDHGFGTTYNMDPAGCRIRNILCYMIFYDVI